MKHKIIAAGKPALKFAKDGVAEYLKRLSRYGVFAINHVKDGTSSVVSERLKLASEGTLRIVMDERGELLNTKQLVELTMKWELQGVKRVSYLVGASDGHSQELRESADLVWALSPMTFQHELALLLLMEQLYRVETIKRGEPYHR